jgi:SAM-dependent methyltransferase
LNIFDEYASYYDLIYQRKDFVAEVDFVHKLIQRRIPGAASILDLGCGTGVHAAIFAEMGYRVHGVDQSSRMLVEAARRRELLAPKLQDRVLFEQNDIRSLRLHKSFDAIVLLFNVINYQTRDMDLQAVFTSVASHLKPKGILVFDFWHGPAVIADPPAVRRMTVENKHIQVSRLATPSVFFDRHLVDVNYTITITEKLTARRRSFSELHRMRYLFKPELDLFLKEAGMVPNDFGEWLSNRPPGPNTWKVWMSAALSF